MFAIITTVLFFIAFLLLLLVTLSVPIIKSVFLFKLSANVASKLLNAGANGTADFGVWGYCISSVDVSVVGIDHTTTEKCSAKHLGYIIDNVVTNAFHADNVRDIVSRAITAALVLHPIVAGLTFIAFLISLSTLRRNMDGSSRLPSLCTVATGLLAGTLAIIVFLIDVIFVGITKHKVGDISDGNLRLNWGNAVWMTLGATIAIWLAMIAASPAACICCRRQKIRETKGVNNGPSKGP